MEDEQDLSRTRIAHRRLKVNVESEHIALAMPHDSGHCMIADAITDGYKFAKHVSVDLATIRFTDAKSSLRYVFLTPPIVQQSLLDFDQGVEIKPFQFQLRTAMQIAPKRKKKAGRKHAKSSNVYEHKRLEIASPTNGTKTDIVPVVVGGMMPKSGALSNRVRTGRIRRFGLRLLKP